MRQFDSVVSLASLDARSLAEIALNMAMTFFCRLCVNARHSFLAAFLRFTGQVSPLFSHDSGLNILTLREELVILRKVIAKVKKPGFRAQRLRHDDLHCGR